MNNLSSNSYVFFDSLFFSLVPLVNIVVLRDAHWDHQAVFCVKLAVLIPSDFTCVLLLQQDRRSILRAGKVDWVVELVLASGEKGERL